MHSPVNELVDAVFVLSVRSFHGRIAHIEAELGRHGIAFEWIFDYDAATGLLGLVAFAWFLFSAARQYVRGAFEVVGIALLVAWSLTSLFSSHFHTFNEGHLIAILLGVCLARENPAGTQSRSAESTADRTA